MIEFDIIPRLKLVWFRGSGVVTYDHLMKEIGEVNRHPDFAPDFNTFVDFGDAEVSFRHGGFSQYQKFFERHQLVASKRRWAIYTDSAETFRNAAMAHLAMDKTIAVRVFELRNSALEWLGVPDPAQPSAKG